MAVHNPLRVLILDDCEVIPDTLCMILNKSGFEARPVYTHRAAILAAHAFTPDVLLTGFNNCGEKNGCETAAEVLSFLPECRMIVFSGSAAAAPVLQEFSERGYAYEVMAKPLHPIDLINVLRGPAGPFMADEPRETPPLPPEPFWRRFNKIPWIFKRRSALD